MPASDNRNARVPNDSYKATGREHWSGWEVPAAKQHRTAATGMLGSELEQRSGMELRYLLKRQTNASYRCQQQRVTGRAKQLDGNTGMTATEELKTAKWNSGGETTGIPAAAGYLRS